MKPISTTRILGVAALLAVLVPLLLPVSGRADTLDFGIMVPTPGTISYGGGSAPLVGTNIQVDNVTDLTTSVAFNLIGGLLNFTSGASNGTWTWGNNGSSTAITLTAQCVDTNNDGDTTCDAQDLGGTSGPITLMNGPIQSAQVIGGGGSFKISLTTFTDVKNAGLLAAFGDTGPNAWNGNTNISFNATSTTTGGAFSSSTVLSGDVVNEQVPEPATLSLLGLGLLGAGLFGRKKVGKRT